MIGLGQFPTSHSVSMLDKIPYFINNRFITREQSKLLALLKKSTEGSGSNITIAYLSAEEVSVATSVRLQHV